MTTDYSNQVNAIKGGWLEKEFCASGSDLYHLWAWGERARAAGLSLDEALTISLGIEAAASSEE